MDIRYIIIRTLVELFSRYYTEIDLIRSLGTDNHIVDNMIDVEFNTGWTHIKLGELYASWVEEKNLCIGVFLLFRLLLERFELWVDGKN